MHHALARALDPVLRDARFAGLVSPVFEAYPYEAIPDRAWVLFGAAGVACRVGVSIRLDGDPVEQIVEAADVVQEWFIETVLWPGRPTNWPVCPDHPDTHPLAPRLVDSTATWVCPVAGTVIAPIGSLAVEHPR